MKATELRIENIVHDGFFTNKQIVVNSIGNDSINNTDTISGSFGIPIDKIEPIPLTEEWLVKFGFWKKDWAEGVVYENNCFTIQLTDEVWMLCDNDFNNLSPIQFVHQLQNLYFALTGEELEWK